MTRERASTLAAGLLAVAVLWLGTQYGSTTAGGADSYGYVSQAGLWQAGGLMIHQDMVAASRWPFAAATWTPLGFVPSRTTRDAIVPSYAPGYPLLIALAQIVAGYCAGFLVVPICGALTMVAAYVFGRRLFPPVIALAGALLIATSPVFLYQLVNPMSDVPVTAAWTASLAFAIWNFPLCAGLAAAMAIAIRPNLAAIAVVLFAWFALTDRRALARAALGVAPAIAGIAWLNARLYGSPFVSGYGSLGDLYALGHLPANVRLFAMWTLDVQTPLVLAAALYFIAPGWTAARPIRGTLILTGGTIAAVVGSYLFYRPFDAWWYLRFLLPAWPVILLLSAAGIDGLARRWAVKVHAPLTAALVLAWSAYGVGVANARGTFEFGRVERAYVEVGRFVEAHTEPDAVILSMQHSGSVRLYADRLTLRYDRLEPAWLDRAIDSLEAAGRHPYLVLAGFEEDQFRARFAGVSRIGALDWAPMAVHATTRVAVYDAVNRSRSGSLEIITAAGRNRARWRCDPPQIWPPRVRMK